MKKLLVLVLVVAALVGCSPKKKTVDFETVKNTLSPMMDIQMKMESDLEAVKGYLNESDVTNVTNALFVGGTMLDASKLIVVEVKEGTDTKGIETSLNTILTNDKETFSWYQSEGNEFVNDGKVIVKDNYVLLIIATNASEMETAFNDLFK